MKNSDIGALLRRINATLGVKAIKLPSIGGYLESGCPDILIIAHGTPIFIEVKHGKQQLTPIQHKRAEQWRAAGAIVAVCREAEEVLELVAAACLQKALQDAQERR